MRPVQKEEKQMEIILTFVFCMIALLCLTVILILVLAMHDNIKELQFRISFTKGVEVKSLFYKKK